LLATSRNKSSTQDSDIEYRSTARIKNLPKFKLEIRKVYKHSQNTSVNA